MFVDQAVIRVVAGTGGSGAEAFRRESGVPLGGPSGGDGGHGGDVVLLADVQLATLLDFRYRREYRAERGQHGEGSNRTGRTGQDLLIRVPVGTLIKDADSGEVLGELIEDGEQVLIAKGGRGGRGNAAFATPTNRAPRHWEPGGEGQERSVVLELKLIADVGLVGKPNAGKSTFLAAVSAATPKIADYPFTTLTPNLGVVQLSDHRTFVIADIPGIIEGAHEGRGLGLRFLRHIERTRTLAFMIPVDSDDPQAEYALLREEIEAYSESLAAKPHCVMLTRADLLGPDTEPPTIDAAGAWGTFVVSSVAGIGLTEVLEALWTEVRKTVHAESSVTGEEAEWRP
jgi:GTP-binding protein